MTPSRPGAARSDIRLRQATALVGAMLCASALIAYLLWLARADALDSAQTTALNYARTLEVRMDSTFRRADSVLRTVANTLPAAALEPGAESTHSELVQRQLESLRFGFDELIALRVIDRHGDQRYASPLPMATAVNYADRSFFAAYRSDPKADLLFSEVLLGRLTTRQTMVITRAIRDADGAMLGAALAPVELGYFQEHFRKLDIGSNGAVFLRRADKQGQLVLRWPQIDEEVNRPMPATHPIWLAVAAGQREALSEYVAFTDQVQRIAGTVRLQGYPFYLTVALSQDDVLAGWRRLALTTAVVWLALLGLVAALFCRVWRADRQRRRLETQLREAQRMESLGTLVGGIAHDFNNIMAAILGNVAMARDDVGPGHRAQESLEQIRKAGARARTLVQQILAFSRRQPPARRSQPLQPLVLESLALLQSTRPASIRLMNHLAAEPLHAMVDATQIQQVLLNLCTNAWHAMEDRPGTVQVGLKAVDVDAARPLHGDALPSGRYAHLWVSDTGAGMSPETLARVFEPFFTTKPAGQGTGLGLSVVHGIVSAHHGSIRIDSVPGRGTTVHILLPLSEPSMDDGPSATAFGDLPGDLDSSGGGEHVLYVDDDEVVGIMAERMLELAGYRVTLMLDGQAAIDAVAADPQAYDLLVTDFNMPGLSGLDVARAVRALRPDLPIVVSSGYISEDLLRKAAALDVHHVMQKERSAEELARVVADALAR